MTIELLTAHDSWLRAATLLPGLLDPLTLTPGDGQTYRVVTGLVQAEPAARFFAIARGDAPLLGTVLPLDIPFVDYIERMGEWHDLELLWAGWRIFLYVAGRPDAEPPGDIPGWHTGWERPLAAQPLATYALPSEGGRWRIALHRDGPRAFRAIVTDPQARMVAQVAGHDDSEAALASVGGHLATQPLTQESSTH